MQRIANVLVIAPAALIACKVIAFQRRRVQPKSGTDWSDIAMLLLTFPDLKREAGPVLDHLNAAGATQEAHTVWRALVAHEFRQTDEDDGY